MVDQYFIPHKQHIPAPDYTKIEATLQQQVEESVRAALPPFYNNKGHVYLYVTVHIHYCDHAVRGE
jgi:hypothetical protein